MKPPEHPRRQLQHCRRGGCPAVISAPRLVTGRRREAGILAPGSLRSSPSQGRCLSGFSDVRSPVTVAGAAAVSNRVPIQIPCGNLARAGDHTEYRQQVNPTPGPATARNQTPREPDATVKPKCHLRGTGHDTTTSVCQSATMTAASNSFVRRSRPSPSSW
jgi:hypothetical protein